MINAVNVFRKIHLTGEDEFTFNQAVPLLIMQAAKLKSEELGQYFPFSLKQKWNNFLFSAECQCKWLFSSTVNESRC